MDASIEGPVPEVVIIAGLHRGKVKKSLLPLDSIDVHCCKVVMCRKYFAQLVTGSIIWITDERVKS